MTHNMLHSLTSPLKTVYIQILFFFNSSTSKLLHFSDFIWPFLPPYMGVISNKKMAFIFSSSCILALIFPISMNYFPNGSGKGSFPKSQLKSLHLMLVEVERGIEAVVNFPIDANFKICLVCHMPFVREEVCETLEHLPLLCLHVLGLPSFLEQYLLLCELTL